MSQDKTELPEELVNSFNEIFKYSLKDDERFKSADDIEETHVKTTDW